MSRPDFQDRGSTKSSSSAELHTAIDPTSLPAAPDLPSVPDDTDHRSTDSFDMQVSRFTTRQVLRNSTAVQGPAPLPCILSEHYKLLAAHSSLFATKINVKCFLLRRICSAKRMKLRIREVGLANGSLSVSMITGHIENSCYIEYISCMRRWRVLCCPNGVTLRIVDTEELSERCKRLITVAGCVFKTSSDTIKQDKRPIEIPARALRNVFESLGFFCVEKEPLYRLFVPRTRRGNRVVISVLPYVDAHGENRPKDIIDDANKLVALVDVFCTEKVAMVVENLRERSKDILITMRGREIVESKFSASTSIVLM